MPVTPATEQRVSELCDHFAAELRRGSPITIEEFVADHPDCQELLRPALTAVRAMLALGISAENQTRLPSPGDVLGDFKIVRLISHGGMGVVYQAEQLSLSRVVALKVLAQYDPNLPCESSLLVRFHNEMRAVASLQHPHIVPVYAVGTSGHWHFFAMQLIDGMSWQSWNVRMPPADQRDWRIIATAVRDVALGLQHAHERGVLHRDIKPSNLLRDVQGEVWIVDFGLASYPSAASVTATGDVVGTLRYMGPEQLKPGIARNDPRCDIYSLGASFYEMLTGKPVVEGVRKSEQLCALVNHNYPLPRQIVRDLPMALETIVLKMIACDPQDRYLTAKEVAQDIDRWLANVPIQAKRLSLLQHSVRWSRAHAGLMLTLILGMTLSVMLMAFLSSQLLTVRNRLRQQLMISHAAEAQARTTSRRPGQRFEALSSIAQVTQAAGSQGIPVSMQHALLTTTATALSLVDAQPLWQVPRAEGGSLDSVVFSRDHLHCTRADGYRIEVLSMPEAKVVSEFSLESEPLTICLCDPWLVALRGPESAPTLEVWNWADKKRQWSMSANRFPAVPKRFAIDTISTIAPRRQVGNTPSAKPHVAEAHVAMGLENGDVVIVDCSEGNVLFHLQPEQPYPVGQVQFAPDGKSLAATHMAPGNTISVWDLASREIEAHWSLPDDAFTLGWSPDSSRLAVGSGYDVYVYDYDCQRGYQTQLAHLTGPQEIIANIYFHPSNRWLAVYGYDGKTRLWDVDSQVVRLVLEGHAHCFHPSDNSLAFRTYDTLGVWKLGLDDVVWHQQDTKPQVRKLEVCRFIHDDQWLVVAGPHGLHVRDVSTHAPLLDVSHVYVSDLIWLPKSKQLLVASEQGLWSVPLGNFVQAIDAGRRSASLDAHSPKDFQDVLQPTRLALPDNQQPLTLDASVDGRTLALTTLSGGLLWSHQPGDWVWLAQPGSQYTFVSLSEDGNFAAGSAKNLPLTTVWSLSPHAVAWPIETLEGGAVKLAQLDGHWHALTSEQHRYRWWRLSNNSAPSLLFDIQRPSGYQKSALARGKQHLFAIAIDSISTRIFDAKTASTIVNLIDGYQTDRTLDLCFDSECRQLAMVLGNGGFLVWNLERLKQEFALVGLQIEMPAVLR